MKGMDLFCSSPASTAVTTYSSMVRRSRSTKSSSNYDHEERSRKNQPHHHHVPCSSQLPINPKAYLEKHRKSTSAAEKEKQNSDTEKPRRKSSVHVNDLYTHHDSTVAAAAGSSRRYLLDDVPFIDWVSESSNKIRAMAPQHEKGNDSSPALIRSSSSAHSKDQVVVLRVSLHCKACEGKVRKHISKMEGVTSFSIDMETKKVTITGDVTPLGVLASLSKVKNAQLWPSVTSSSSSSVLLSSSSTLTYPKSVTN